MSPALICAAARQSVGDRRHLLERRDGAFVGLAGADADRLLERHDEDLAVADLAGPRALAQRVDRRLDESSETATSKRTFSASPIFTVVPR